jgi:hypothetical protein
MRVIGPRRLNIGGILVRLGYSPEWRWVKRPKRGGFGSVVELVGIGVMLGTPRGAENHPKRNPDWLVLVGVSCICLLCFCWSSSPRYTLSYPAKMIDPALNFFFSAQSAGCFRLRPEQVYCPKYLPEFEGRIKNGHRFRR